jgi:hypothetical protein
MRKRERIELEMKRNKEKKIAEDEKERNLGRTKKKSER